MKTSLDYVAGLIDGRACLSIHKWTHAYGVKALFCSSNILLLEKIKSTLHEYASSTIVNRGIGPDGKRRYELYFSPIETVKLLKLVVNKLKYKQDEAKFLLNFHAIHSVKTGRNAKDITWQISRLTAYNNYKLLKLRKKQYGR